MKPDLTKKSGKLSVTLSKLNLTSSSSRIQLVVDGLEKGKPTPIQYEFVDDQGNELKMLFGHGSDDDDNNGVIYYDFVTDALSKDAKSITVKAYKPEYKEPGATSGPYKLDSNGKVVKNYVKELEMTVDIK
ncbi:hypothetical protein HMSSN036_40870 [Paenibacillus macerans]|nr:hypothetical protein HMSSN036_40870 [Paenibacillus macerans]